MTNITLSINDKTFQRMRDYSEIKWSEFVRKAIEQRLKELERIDETKQESILAMLASQDILQKEWDNEQDERWNNV